jgi:hypothetical protein
MRISLTSHPLPALLLPLLVVVPLMLVTVLAQLAANQLGKKIEL